MDTSFLTRQFGTDLRRFDAERPALRIEDEPVVSYGQLAQRAEAYAGALRERGVARGDRVAMLMYNSVEYVIAYFAITRLGAIAVRLNFRLESRELEYVLNDSGATLLLVDHDLWPRVAGIRARTPVQRAIVRGLSGACERTEDWSVLESSDPIAASAATPSPDDGAMIMYTSGTTGRPKGVLWSHATTTWWTAMQQIEWQHDTETVTMTTGPAYHIGGLENYLLPTLAAGGLAVMSHSRGFDLERILGVAQRCGVTDLLLFPTMINQLVTRPGLAHQRLQRLRRIFTGGDALAPTNVDRLRELLPAADLIQVYGLTEGTPIATCSAPGQGYAQPCTAGRPLPFVEVTIRDDAGHEVAPGMTGEIWTRSPANSLGYWNNPDETAATFSDGWCHTGDLGILNEGALQVSGRKKDMIRSGGENISPAEIEDVLLRHAAVVDAAVVGVPDPVFLEAVCAVVVVNDVPVTSEDLVDHCRRHLASYKKPRQVVFVSELPRTASQKIQKFRIRQMVADAASTRP